MTDFFVTAAAIATCVCEALKTEWPGSDVDCCVRPASEVAWDSCCETPSEGPSQVWVAMKGGYPTITFPNADLDQNETTCFGVGASLAVRYEIGVLRCVCFDMCDCDVAEENAHKVFRDLQAVLAGLQCCFTDNFTGPCGDKQWRLQAFRTVGPDGGCAGSIIEILVNEPLPCCPEEN